jgi:tRNA (adenine37-N6)-methyltransferase
MERRAANMPQSFVKTKRATAPAMHFSRPLVIFSGIMRQQKFDGAESCVFTPIGHIECARRHRYETPRQGVLAPGNTGVLRLIPNMNFEQALRELDRFERVWILYVFHLNKGWRPLVRVPRRLEGKVGVFATRAPYRPNPIGLTCARLLKIEGLDIHLDELDILDGTPVLDIKPYLPYADAFPLASAGWTRNPMEDIFKIEYAVDAARQADWILERCSINLRGFIDVQLRQEPADTKRKRIGLADPPMESGDCEYVLAYRTWRIRYRILNRDGKVLIDGIGSGYGPVELISDEDRYGDKKLHREFETFFHGLRT